MKIVYGILVAILLLTTCMHFKAADCRALRTKNNDVGSVSTTPLDVSSKKSISGSRNSGNSSGRSLDVQLASGPSRRGPGHK